MPDQTNVSEEPWVSPVHVTPGVDHDFVYREAFEAGERAGLERAARMVEQAAGGMTSSSEDHLVRVRAFAKTVVAGLRIAARHYVGEGSLAGEESGG